MRSYTFRLETVLRVRRVESLLRQYRVAGVARSLLEADRRERAAGEANEMAMLGVGEQDAPQFLADLEQSERRGADLVAAAAAREGLQSDLADARADAISAQRRVAILESLDNRRREEWAMRAQRENTAILDDFATVRAARIVMERNDDR